MIFPFVYKSKKQYFASGETQKFRDALFEKIRIKVLNSGIKNIVITENEIKFKGQIFRFAGNGWNILNGVTSGSVSALINSNELMVKVKLCFLEVFGICLAFTIIPVSILLNVGSVWNTAAGKMDHQTFGLIFLLIIWVFVYLGNYIYSFIVFNKFLSKEYENLVKEFKI